MLPNTSILPHLGSYRARISGHNEAVYDYTNQKHYTYDDLSHRADLVAAFLVEELGLKKGDRVGFVSENAVPFLDVFFASFQTGIIMTTYNCMMGKRNLAYLLERETPKVIFYTANRPEVIENFRTDGVEREYIAIIGEPDERDHYSYADVMAYQPKGTARYETPDFEDIQMLIHTGGTTGDPKAAMMSYRSLFFNTTSQILTVGVSSADSGPIFLPFFHTAGWNVVLMPLLFTGGRVILTEGFDPGVALKIINEEKPSMAIAVEMMYKYMAAHPLFPQTDFTCFRWMLNGAAPISRETMELYWSRGVKLINAYGMTEVGPANLVQPLDDMTPEEVADKWNAAGKPMYYNNVRVVDDDGNDVEPGKPGELLFCGPLTFSGYWQDEEKTNQLIKDGWVYTGDIVYQDEDGYFYICGRKKNMFISGGENIFPIEIEQILDSHPGVESSCVIGVPDPRWGEVGKALIIPKANSAVTKEELRAHVLTESSSIKVPKYIQFVEIIPKNSVGKLDLKLIRELYSHSSET